MIDKVFNISGYLYKVSPMYKLSSMVIDKDALKVTTREGGVTVEEFRQDFAKTLPLAVKVEIKYDAIKEIRTGANDNGISISHKAFAGMGAHCQFEFYRKEDIETFIDYFIRQKKYEVKNVTLSPYRYIWAYLFCVIPTVFIAAMACIIINNDVAKLNLHQVTFFELFISKLTEKGILVIAALVTAYFAYLILKKIRNPSRQLVLTPPHNL